jgi:hypothetical protein
MRRALRAIWRAAVASPATRWLPWAIWVLVVGVFAAISGAALDDGLVQFISYLLFVLAFTTVGALVASRRPRNAIGWLLLLAGGSYVLGGLSEHAVDGGNASALVAWVGEWIWLAGIGPVATFGLLLFPTGHLPSPRWRPVAWLAAASVVASVMAIAFKPGRFEGSAIENPLGIPGLPDWTGTAALLVLLAAVAGSIASLRARYRAAGQLERMQLKWLLYAAALVAAGVVVTAPLEALVGEAAVDITNLVVSLTLSAVPVAMGIAILRHRLYDIDLVIRRTLVYAVLTATLAGAYLGSVLLVGLAVGRSGFAVAISTLAVAALFRPALRRIQAVVDRRFYRRRYDAALTLEAFGNRLRDELDLETLGADLRDVVRETAQPASVTLWLRSEQ